MIEPCSFPANDEERSLLARAAKAPASADWTDLTEDTLRVTAAEYGIDFATAVLFDRLVRSREHGPFIEQLHAPLPAEENGRAGLPTVVIVPGAFYLEERASGADGHFLMEELSRLGCRTRRIPLHSFGPLADNARIICDWLRRQPDEPLVLVSLSKAAAEMKLALAAPDTAEIFRNVTAWISLSGIFFGTPLVTWLRSQPWRLPLIRLFFWYRGYHYPALWDLERGAGRLLDFELRPPEHLRMIHVVGFPLARHLSTPLARRGHRRLTPLGPNDGGPILLADLRRLPGLICPVWGADHYLRPAWNTALVAKILRFVRCAGEVKQPV